MNIQIEPGWGRSADIQGVSYSPFPSTRGRDRNPRSRRRSVGADLAGTASGSQRGRVSAVARALAGIPLLVACGVLLAVGAVAEPPVAPATQASSPGVALQVSEPACVVSVPTLREAILDLQSTFGPRYPRAQAFLARLNALEAASDAAGLRSLAREALVANPLVSGQPLLYICRKQYRSDHHNTETFFQTGEINTGSYDTHGVIKTVDLAAGGRVTTVFDPGPEATARDPELSFDGRRLVFSMRRNRQDDYHLYEIAVDGTGLRQLTSAPGVTDLDPLYLPDGGIVFSSTRDPKYCMCNRHIMANLYRMEADGANIHQIGKSTLFEGHSTLMPDGRILYDRWEYVDRNFGDAQGLWTVNPDGTGHAVFWGNNTASPGGVIDARMIPGTSLCLAVFAACHDRPWGALAIVDRSKGVDGRAPVVRTWPADFVNQVNTDGWQQFDSPTSVKLRYEDPYPLSDRYFLATRMTGRGEETVLVLLDTFGNELVIHEDGPGCFDPMPVAARTAPPARPPGRDFVSATGRFYVANAYEGTHMAGVPPGAIKFLRVVESPPKKNWSAAAWDGQGQQAPAMNWMNFENKRILGTVPVAEDGSAYFEAPANTFLFFQVLDGDGRMIQSMRSGTLLQPGEVQGCVGCHEDRVGGTPSLQRQPRALSRAPDSLAGWFGPPRTFSFRAEVQPVFDRHCLPCHDFGGKGAEKLVLAADTSVYFNAAYIDLWAQQAITCVGAGPAETRPAYSWGSHASKLIRVLREGHEDVKLSPEEMARLITWVDLNAPYYPEYESVRPENPGGRAPITGAQLARLQQLTGLSVAGNYGARQRALVSFDRPELSPILAKLNPAGAEYREALAIIQAGRDILARSQPDYLPGFTPCETDQRRNAKYQARVDTEERVYEAIRTGRKVYDPELRR